MTLTPCQYSINILVLLSEGHVGNIKGITTNAELGCFRVLTSN